MEIVFHNPSFLSCITSVEPKSTSVPSTGEPIYRVREVIKNRAISYPGIANGKIKHPVKAFLVDEEGIKN